MDRADQPLFAYFSKEKHKANPDATFYLVKDDGSLVEANRLCYFDEKPPASYAFVGHISTKLSLLMPGKSSITSQQAPHYG